MDKLERLMNLTMTLLETERPLRAEELRRRIPGYPDKLESFRRAFERDKEELRDMGIPLSLEPIVGADPPADGYRIHKSEYYLRDPNLDPDELAALHLAAAAVRLEGMPGDDALWRLGGAPTGPDDDGSLADGLDVALRGDPNLGPLFGAVVDRRMVTFTYNGQERTVEPLRLDFERGWWYLTGFDHLRSSRRVYRVDRVESTVVSGKPGSFDRAGADARPGGSLDPWELGEGEPVTARLLVDPHQAGRATVALGEARIIERRADGSIVFGVSVVNWPAFRSFVLGFLEHAELLEPQQWRDAIRDWLEAIIR